MQKIVNMIQIGEEYVETNISSNSLKGEAKQPKLQTDRYQLQLAHENFWIDFQEYNGIKFTSHI